MTRVLSEFLMHRREWRAAPTSINTDLETRPMQPTALHCHSVKTAGESGRLLVVWRLIDVGGRPETDGAWTCRRDDVVCGRLQARRSSSRPVRQLATDRPTARPSLTCIYTLFITGPLDETRRWPGHAAAMMTTAEPPPSHKPRFTMPVLRRGGTKQCCDPSVCLSLCAMPLAQKVCISRLWLLL